MKSKYIVLSLAAAVALFLVPDTMAGKKGGSGGAGGGAGGGQGNGTCQQDRTCTQTQARDGSGTGQQAQKGQGSGNGQQDQKRDGSCAE